MLFTRLFPRVQFFRNFSAALFALFILTNFADSSFTRVFAPVAAKTVAAAEEFVIPSDIPSSGR